MASETDTVLLMIKFIQSDVDYFFLLEKLAGDVVSETLVN